MRTLRKMAPYAAVLFCVVLLVPYGTSMTDKQVKAAGKLTRNTCQPKTKVTDETIANQHKGIWDESDQNGKCYMYCVLTMFKIAKKTGEFDMESATAQVPQMPEDKQEELVKAMTNCNEKLTGNYGDDKCDNAWKFGRCFYLENPAIYILP